MISGLLKKIFGSRNDRLIKQYSAVVRKINALEAGISALSDDDLRSLIDNDAVAAALCGGGVHGKRRADEALAAVQSVATSVIAARAAESGVTGQKVGEMIHAARVRAVAAWLLTTAAD